MWSFQYGNLAATGTLTLAKGSATLEAVIVNTGATSAVLTVYDNTAGSGTKIATVDATSKSYARYRCRTTKGLTAVLSGGNADVTLVYA